MSNIDGLLVCTGVKLRFGGIVALDGVDMTVETGEVVGIIGPNGSGKTSLINVLSGFYRPTAGSVVFDGHRIDRHRPQELRRRGIARVFQNLRLFNGLTVLENMELGLVQDMSSAFGVVRATCGSIVGQRQTKLRASARERASALLNENGFGTLANVRVGSLSYGQRKELELLRAILEPPRLLLLDEPTSGVAHSDAEVIKERLLEWQAQFGFAVVIVEHRLGWLFDIAHRVVALSSGTLLAEGTPEEVAADPVVRSAYVGK
ncbi:MAG: ABC transporter ATP-binding protein [Nitrospiraceae bacterium]|nr:ABC transporter ATP-binding protein [Nitrospiraceae bacterium]